MISNFSLSRNKKKVRFFLILFHLGYMCQLKEKWVNRTSSSCNIHRCLMFLVRGRRRRTYFKPANSPFSILPPDTPFTAAIQLKKASLCKHFQVSCLQQNPKAIGSMVEYKTLHKRLASVFLHMVVE